MQIKVTNNLNMNSIIDKYVRGIFMHFYHTSSYSKYLLDIICILYTCYWEYYEYMLWKQI